MNYEKVTISTYNLYEQFGRKLTHTTVERSHDNEVLSDEALKERDGGFEYFDLFEHNYLYALQDNEEAYIVGMNHVQKTVLLQSVDNFVKFILTFEEFEVATNDKRFNNL